MANLTETESYDAGVYQLETTDPVQGGPSGVSNSPHKNLANRTKWLKAHVDALEAAMAASAPSASPVFTGNPTAPNPALADNDQSLATTEWVNLTIGGVLTKSIAGGADVSLSVVEAGNNVFILTGALTANINVIVPGTPKRGWTIKNDTTGVYTVTIKLSTGTGVAVSQGRISQVWTDGTNVYSGRTDFHNTSMTGVPTVPTPTLGSNSTQAANTAFVESTIAAKFESLNTASGYQKMANGLILQWGTATGDNTDVVFPIAFPATVLMAPVGGETNALSSDAGYIFQCGSVTRFGFKAFVRSDAGAPLTPVSVKWFAIGY